MWLDIEEVGLLSTMVGALCCWRVNDGEGNCQLAFTYYIDFFNNYYYYYYAFQKIIENSQKLSEIKKIKISNNNV